MSNELAVYEERPLTAADINTAYALDAVYQAMSKEPIENGNDKAVIDITGR